MKKYFLLSVLIILIDQITKFIVEKYLYFKQIIVIDSFLHFTYVQNRGGAWGIFGDTPVLFLVLVPIAVGLLIYMLKKCENKLEKISIAMIIAGALGNYIDRIVRGYVVDFFDFLIWPVFNVADIFVVVGGILFVLSAIRLNKDGK